MGIARPENGIARPVHVINYIAREPSAEDEIDSQLTRKRYAEPAPEAPASPRTWYLPHFAVVHPQKVGWASNDQTHRDREPEASALSIGDHTERTLGLIGRRKRHVEFFVKFTKLSPRSNQGYRPPTKREVTSAVMSVFDPIGVTPYHTEGELHVFTDASEKAYSAAVYWLEKIKTAARRISGGESPGSPLKPVSIPRLEPGRRNGL
ncbi:hypothetical protein EVAR_87759_1 [Eumeta japonica]|uniref:Uncharacterized protein n=1 Tax=Eumeta variegata TaxID=151549 RepID=A0A4C1THA3_EUMVA|nr:hypothetical protein EVAR_87759_1 [Eumeta japonica]